ncbi:MAG TPA: pyridoxal phosphate-dependent aminotransferase [Chloroflexi bacterium]|nr:pyridoxal phosphate-dependent aminotransferase [Chloroflexota bacterium]
MSTEQQLAGRVQALLGQMSNPLAPAMREVKDIIPLSQGDPDLDTPRHIVHAAQEALEQGYTHYTPIKGLGELRVAIARKFEADNGLTVDPAREVIVTSGAQEAVFAAVQTLLDKGDQLLVPDPFYTAYRMAACMAEAELVPIRTYERDSYLLQPEALEEQITPRSKVLLIINPTMPASGIYSRQALERLADVVLKHNLTVISDELYEKILFNDVTHTSIAGLPEMRDRTITLNGVSKTYCMTGWRVGYAAGPARWIDGMEAVKQALTICTPAVSQKAALAALEGPQEFVAESLAIYDQRRRTIIDRLERLGITYGTWNAGYSVLANIRPSGLSAVDFAEKLLRETHVYAGPGENFGKGGEGTLRVSFLVPQPKLNQALDGLERVWKSVA